MVTDQTGENGNGERINTQNGLMVVLMFNGMDGHSMTRVLSRQWADKKPFSRRVRWYCAGLEPELRTTNIRLEFEDSNGVCHRFYKSNVELANTDWERFKQGIGTLQLRNEQVEVDQ